MAIVLKPGAVLLLIASFVLAGSSRPDKRPRTDLDGDPLPPGALARLGSSRWRLQSEPRRILLSPDGKTLAIGYKLAFFGIDGLIGEFVDASTGKRVGRIGEGAFAGGTNMGMVLALSPDWKKVAALEQQDTSGVIAIRRLGTKKEPVMLAYSRRDEFHKRMGAQVKGKANGYGTMEYPSCIQFSPDGKALAAAIRLHFDAHNGNQLVLESEEDHIMLWDAHSGKQLLNLPPLDKEQISLRFSSDGQTLTSAGKDGMVRCWDLATGKDKDTPRKAAQPLFCATYSPDGCWLALAGKGSVLMWRTDAGKVVRRLAFPGEQATSLAFTPDGKLLAGSGKRSIRLWNVKTGDIHGDCLSFPARAEAVGFSADNKVLFSGHEGENALRRWDVATCKPIAPITGHAALVQTVAFTPDSKHVLTSASLGDFLRWDAESGKPCPAPKAAQDEFMTQSFASAARTGLCRCEDTVAASFAMAFTGKISGLERIPGLFGFSVNGRRAILRTQKDKKPCLVVIDSRTEKPVREFLWEEGKDVSGAIAPDGQSVVAASNELVSFFDVASGKERRYDFEPPKGGPVPLFGSVALAKFSPDGSRVALLGAKGKIRVVAARDGRRLAEFSADSEKISGMGFSPDSQTLLTTGFIAPVSMWEIASGQLIRSQPPGNYLFSPDGRLLAVAAGDGINVHEAHGGGLFRKCGGLLGAGNFTFSPNGKLLAVSDADSTVLIWDMLTRESPRKPHHFRQKELGSLWQDLHGEATKAYQAIGTLIGDPERVVPFLEKHLRPTPGGESARLQKLLQQLDSGDFKERQDASKELLQLGVVAEAAMRAALENGGTLEAQRRLQRILRELEEKQKKLPADELAHLRSIQVLEQLGTATARALLAKLAAGAPAAPRTRHAGEALRRLGSRKR